MSAVTVVGGGVIGLTCALELAHAGHEVTVVSADPPGATTSAVAAALWFPYEAAPEDDVLRWGQVSLRRFTELAGVAGTGVHLRDGTVVHRTPEPDLAWTRVVPGHRPAEDLPAGATSGVRCRLPVIEMDVHLAWLTKQVEAAGAAIEHRRVERISDLGGLVVLAAGLASAALAGDDDSVEPIRGQVVRLANPGLTDWLIDDDHPDGLTYVVPRDHDVVVGGVAERGADSLDVDPATEAAILARARALVPELRDAPVVSRGVGLRPSRPSVRLERRGDVVHCYGHGGAGVTLSWGCAADVAALLDGR